MPSWQLSRAAEADLADIAAYSVEAFGIDRALSYRDGLIRTLAFLAENPKGARLRSELKPPLRAHRFQSHLIFYDVLQEGGIMIVRIRHGREDWLAGDER